MHVSEGQAPQLYPAWKQALYDIEAAGLQPGQTIDKQWLENAFGLKPAQTISDFERNRHLFRAFFWNFRTQLLERHQLMLRPIAGVGYEVVEPQHQTAVALRDRGHAIGQEIKKLSMELQHIRADALTDDQRKANADALAKVGLLGAMAEKQLQIGKTQ